MLIGNGKQLIDGRGLEVPGEDGRDERLMSLFPGFLLLVETDFCNCVGALGGPEGYPMVEVDFKALLASDLMTFAVLCRDA